MAYLVFSRQMGVECPGILVVRDIFGCRKSWWSDAIHTKLSAYIHKTWYRLYTKSDQYFICHYFVNEQQLTLNWQKYTIFHFSPRYPPRGQNFQLHFFPIKVT